MDIKTPKTPNAYLWLCIWEREHPTPLCKAPTEPILPKENYFPTPIQSTMGDSNNFCINWSLLLPQTSQTGAGRQTDVQRDSNRCFQMCRAVPRTDIGDDTRPRILARGETPRKKCSPNICQMMGTCAKGSTPVLRPICEGNVEGKPHQEL